MGPLHEAERHGGSRGGGTGGSGPWLTVVGSTMIDLVAYATRMPERGETVVGDRFAQGFGGKGANQAVMASLMGARVAMVNAVGDDGYGEQTLANFARHGIDTTPRPAGPRLQRRGAHLGRAGRQQPHHHRPRREPGLLTGARDRRPSVPRSAWTPSSGSSRSTRP